MKGLGMDWLIENAFYVIAVASVVGIALLGSLLAAQRNPGGMGFFSSRDRRLGVVEQTSVDGRRKLLLVRRDNVEHLVLIGGPIDIILETGIASPTRTIEALQTREVSPPLYTNGHADLYRPVEIPSPSITTQALQKDEGYRPPVASPFKTAARRLFSKLSLPIIAEPQIMSSQETAEVEKSVMVELGDERQAEKIT